MSRYLAAVLLLIGLPATAEELIEFNRDVRPILSDRCFACHGPDEQTREAELRLDEGDSATRDAGGYRVIVEGNADMSALIHRVTSTDEDEMMPPPEYGKPLTSSEIAILRKWINQGAAYQRHWSLEPLKRPLTPNVESGQPENPIDAFVRARLQSEGFTPVPQADPRTLVRRLSFDLTGLPPTPEQVEAFAGESTDQTWAALVDQMLTSRHYGERMALYWLDLVRYADTLGYHGDQPRSVSPYRDYVINAFNDNKPFDEFTAEQLAGDLMPNPTLWQRVASTYNRLNRASGEGGVQPKEYLAKYSADRVRTTGAVWLGSTLGCAECHDHKFDPFTARDFYSFAAFFADIKEQGIVRSAVHIEKLAVPTSAQSARLEALSRETAELEKQFDEETPELIKARDAWEQQVKSAADRWSVLTPEAAQSEGGATLKVLDDNSVLASGPNPIRDVYVISGKAPDVSAGSSLALRLELLPDQSLPGRGPGRAGNGNVVLHSADMTINGRRVEWKAAYASHSQVSHAPEYVINGHKHGWAILPHVGKPQHLVLSGQLSDKAVSGEVDTTPSQFVIRLTQNHGNRHNIGRFRLAVSTDPDAGRPGTGVSDEIQTLVAIPTDQRTKAQHAVIDTAFRKTTPLLQDVRTRLEKLRGEKEQLEKSVVTTLATTATEPRTIRILPRGDWMDDSGEIVEPAIPHFMGALPAGSDGRLTRLDLANWLTSRDNPLVARTFVNRLWMLMFGHGLARSVDDLGSQGTPPTHPELLDWLAVEFIESGWDVKHMIRLLVTSETYRQSSRADAAMLQRDPYNQLYARQSRWRLDAEMIRDNALSVSGLLNPEIGGLSAKPYQPAGYWAQLNFPKRKYSADVGENQYRRGLYTHWQRTFLHPSLLAFDAPAREECTARRSRSNTPLQSLVLLNDPTFVEAARVLAAEVRQLESTDFSDRLNWLIRRTLMRPPRPNEAKLLRKLYDDDVLVFRASPEEAQRLLSVGAAPIPDDSDVAELAAWTSVARAILNLHETITRY